MYQVQNKAGGPGGGSQGAELCVKLMLPRDSCQGGEYVLYMSHTHGLSLLSIKATMYQALL